MQSEKGNFFSIKPWMYRVPNETLSLFLCLLIITILAYVFSVINITLFIILVVAAFFYVRFSQAQNLGNAIRVYERQFPELYGSFKKFALQLGISKAALYIKQDPYLQAYTLGITSCTVILNSALVEQLSRKEIEFVIAHELGHYAAGHTKLTTIVNQISTNNFLSSLLFGFWNRKCEYTCDRCGLILTKDINSSVSALIKLAIGNNLFNELDMQAYVSQIRASDRTDVKISELMGSHPLITNRIISLIHFWRENFTKTV